MTFIGERDDANVDRGRDGMACLLVYRGQVMLRLLDKKGHRQIE